MTAGKKPSKQEISEITKNLGFKLLDSYVNFCKTRVVIQDKSGYKYDVVLRNLINTDGRINFVDKGNPFTLSNNIPTWLKLNNKSFILTDGNEYFGSDTKLRFYCFDCEDYFFMSWHSVYSGQECSVCTGLQVGEKHSLGYLRDDLVDEWSDKNDVSPFEFGLGSNKKVYWICKTCGYGSNGEWIRDIYSRVSGQGCPACSIVPKVVTDKNRLSLCFPEIATEWHPTKNGDLTPDDVSFGSHKKVWWLCSKCGNEWETRVGSRIKNNGCLACSYAEAGNKRKKSQEEFVDDVYKVFGEEYSVLGEYVDSHSKISIIHNICGKIFYPNSSAFLSKNSGCPKCSLSKGETKIYNWLLENGFNFETEATFSDCIHKRELPFDFYLPNFNLIVEYDGILHYEDKFNNPEEFKLTKKRDKIKTKYCKDNNINLLRIPYWEFENIEKILEQTLFG